MLRSTTVLCVRRQGVVAMAGDGQVTLGNAIMKGKARKVRRMYEGKVLGGFAGSASDGLTLFDKFEGKLQEFGGRLRRAAVELAKDWRTDRALRRLEAMLIVADKESLLVLSGNGEVLEPDFDAAAVGSGGNFAIAAARALLDNTDLGAADIARKSLEIAADLCIYTNREILLETL